MAPPYTPKQIIRVINIPSKSAAQTEMTRDYFVKPRRIEYFHYSLVQPSCHCSSHRCTCSH